jgi:hypothetical protein
MEKEENVGNDYCDEAINYVSEAQEKYVVPGFVHQPPKPTTVGIFLRKNKYLNNRLI